MKARLPAARALGGDDGALRKPHGAQCGHAVVQLAARLPDAEHEPGARLLDQWPDEPSGERVEIVPLGAVQTVGVDDDEVAGSLQADERVAVPVEQAGILRGHGAGKEAERGLDLPGPQDAGHRAGDAHVLDAAAPVDAKEGALGLLARIAVDQQGHVPVRAERLRQRARREALAHAARAAGHERRGGMPLSLSHTSAYAGGKPRGAAA